MKQKRMSKKKRIVIILLSVAVCVALVMIGLMMYGKTQMSRVPGLTFTQAPEYTARGKKGAVITVGIIRDGQASRTVCGEDARELPPQPHTYETGSLTKTFTAALIKRQFVKFRVCGGPLWKKQMIRYA